MTPDARDDRLDHDLVKHYKETGQGRQSRLNDDVRKVNSL
ncbi:BrnA antitoxin family protein [Agrobacterium rosae]|nr:BrnA antitoxin family protein [Agrobacterium rosae]